MPCRDCQAASGTDLVVAEHPEAPERLDDDRARLVGHAEERDGGAIAARTRQRAAPRRRERRPRCRPRAARARGGHELRRRGFAGRARWPPPPRAARRAGPGPSRRGRAARAPRRARRGRGEHRRRPSPPPRARCAAHVSPRASATHPAASSACTRFIPGGHASARSTSRVAASGSSASDDARKPGERRHERLQVARRLAVREGLLERAACERPLSTRSGRPRRASRAGRRPCASRAAGTGPSPPRGRPRPRRGARAYAAPRRGS